jgi:hypothetical protein
MIRAGYPIGKNDLPLEIWEDLGFVNEILEIRMKGVY